jgi:hypothetical protein
VSHSEMMFAYLFSRIETTYEPTLTVAGLSFQALVHVAYIGLTPDGSCQRGVRDGGTGAVVPVAEGRYEITGGEIRFFWPDGALERGRLDGDRYELVVGGRAYEAGAIKPGRAV